MSEGRESWPGRIARLAREIFRLRQIIEQSSFDDRLVDDGFRIHHLLDRPIFGLYAQPHLNSHLVAAIPSLAAQIADEDDGDDESDWADDRIQLVDRIALARDGQKERARDDALHAYALLTGEYIFRLQENDRNSKVYIGPEHLGELYGYVASLEARNRDFYARLENFPDVFSDTRHALNGKKSAFDARLLTSAQWISNVRDVVRAMSGDSNADVLAAYRLRRLFEEQRITSAVDLEEFQSVVAPPIDKVLDWKVRIGAAKRSNRVQPNRNALESDAVTLAQLEMLNASWQRDRNVFLLITSDTGLHLAYTDYIREMRRDSQEVFFPIRDPRQYLPILNVRDMEGRYREPEIFKGVRNAIVGFEAAISSSDFGVESTHPADPTLVPDRETVRRVILDKLKEADGKLAPFMEAIDAQIEEIGDRWLEMIESSIVAKADILSEIAGVVTSIWSQRNAQENLDRMFQGQVAAIATRFETLATSTALLRQEIWALESAIADRGVDNHNRREIVSTYRDFGSAPFRGLNLSEITEQVIALREDAIPLLASVDRTERLLFVGSLCLEIGAWQAAKMLLGRAAAGDSEDAGLKREIRFYRCVARRLAASSLEFAHEYRAVRGELSALAKSRPQADLLESARTLNERLALDLCEIAYLASHAAPLQQNLEKTIAMWGRLFRFHGGQIGTPLADANWQILAKRFLFNTFNLKFWAWVAGVRTPSNLDHTVDLGLEFIQSPDGVDFARGPHADIYPMLAEYAKAPSPAARNRIGSSIRRRIEWTLDFDVSSGFAFDLPLVDRAEYSEILRIVGRNRLVGLTAEP